jgi:hypothetical protein
MLYYFETEGVPLEAMQTQLLIKSKKVFFIPPIVQYTILIITFSSLCFIQTYLHWDSLSLLSNAYKGLFPLGQSGRGVKLTTHPSSSEVNNEWSYTSTPHYAFMAWCSAKIAQGQLYVYVYLSLWNQKVHHRVHKSPLPDPILN